MKNLIFLFIPLFVFFFSAFGVNASVLNSPVVSDFNPGLKTFTEPLVSGTTDKNTNVLVYVDGIYYSDAEIIKSGTVDTFYFYLNSLLSEGMHSFFLISRDMNGVMSPQTIEKSFIFSDKLDTPKILKTSFDSSLYVLGESNNQNYIDLYIDNNLYKTLFIERNSKNLFEFNDANLSKGEHNFFVVARDELGRRSNPTQKTDFFFNKKTNDKKIEIKKPVLSSPIEPIKNENIKTPTISDEGQIEEVIVEGIDNIQNEENKSEDTEKIDEILNNLNQKQDESVGSLNESGESQSDLKMNLIIFLGFLVAVILWIIWVNREINEEETEENQE